MSELEGGALTLRDSAAVQQGFWSGYGIFISPLATGVLAISRHFSDSILIVGRKNRIAITADNLVTITKVTNVDRIKLLGKEHKHFVGPPLNIKDGDGMVVHSVVLCIKNVRLWQKADLRV